MVGAGPLGLTTALAVARAGHRVLVVDDGSPPAIPWTEVLHWSVLPVLDSFDLLADVLRHGEVVTRWGLRVLGTGELLAFDVTDLAGHVTHPFQVRLADSTLRELLTTRVRNEASAQALTGRLVALTMSDQGVTAEVDAGDGGCVVRARFLVADDGPASAVRRESGIAFPGAMRADRTVVALVEHDFGADGYLDTTFQIDGRHGAVVERVSGTLWRYVYEESLDLPEEGVAARLSGTLGAVTSSDPGIRAWTSERTHQRSAATNRAGPVVLLGEAAHATHRLLGHSTISGWSDVQTLVPGLLRALETPDDPRASADLDRWAAWRRKLYLDHAVPASLGRRHLVTAISSAERLDVELDEFRQALTDPDVRLGVLLQGSELAFRTPEPSVVGTAPRS